MELPFIGISAKIGGASTGLNRSDGESFRWTSVSCITLPQCRELRSKLQNCSVRVCPGETIGNGCTQSSGEICRYSHARRHRAKAWCKSHCRVEVIESRRHVAVTNHSAALRPQITAPHCGRKSHCLAEVITLFFALHDCKMLKPCHLWFKNAVLNDSGLLCRVGGKPKKIFSQVNALRLIECFDYPLHARAKTVQNA